MNVIRLKINESNELYAELTLDNGEKKYYKNYNNGNSEDQYLSRLIGTISKYKITSFKEEGKSLSLTIKDIELVIEDLEKFQELNNIDAKSVINFINSNLPAKKEEKLAPPKKEKKEEKVKANRSNTVVGLVSLAVGLGLLVGSVSSYVRDKQKDSSNDIIFNPDIPISGQYIEPYPNYYNPNDNVVLIQPEVQPTPMIPPFNQDNVVVVPNPTPTPVINDTVIIETPPPIYQEPIQVVTPTPIPTPPPVINQNQDLNAISAKVGNDQLLISQMALIGESYNQQIMDLGAGGMTYYNFNTGSYENVVFDNSYYGKAMAINVKFNHCLKTFKGNIFAAILAYYNGINEVQDKIMTEVAPNYGLSYDEFLMLYPDFGWSSYFANFPAYAQVERVLNSLPQGYTIQCKVANESGINYYQAIVGQIMSLSEQDTHANEFIF